mmetsp:Transcript_5217/g.15066  ORF Transcript_5217/g.15066 Transcript_5217/m.15066 type:complete len:322 (-) Transcript_5217:123-1088(-)
MMTMMYTPHGTSGTPTESDACPGFIRSQTSSTVSSSETLISPYSQALRRSQTDMLRDEVCRRRTAEDSFGTDENASQGAPCRRRFESFLLPLPLYTAPEKELGDEPSELNDAPQLKQSSSMEELRQLMSAPVIDWEKIRKVQQNHYENRAQKDENAAGRLGLRRNRSMYSKSSQMRRSIERLDRLVTGGTQQPEKRLQNHQDHVGTSLQRNASWCFSNGVAGGNGIAIDRSATGRRKLGHFSRSGLALSRRKSPAASTAARSLGLVKPQRRQGGNASWSFTEPGMDVTTPALPMAARKAAWDMEVKATLDAAKASILQGDL